MRSIPWKVRKYFIGPLHPLHNLHARMQSETNISLISNVWHWWVRDHQGKIQLRIFHRLDHLIPVTFEHWQNWKHYILVFLELLQFSSTLLEEVQVQRVHQLGFFMLCMQWICSSALLNWCWTRKPSTSSLLTSDCY